MAGNLLTGPETPGIRLHDVHRDGFLIRFDELNLNAPTRSDGRHVTETVGWIASTVQRMRMGAPAVAGAPMRAAVTVRRRGRPGR
ncbi:hypothetical protein [Streptomyces lavenduligriseus]|uniref:Uncharacterized protein n=1 Tax=Streptomyces lavenduligriseus TaxID=67315 RepID=A0ABT0NRP9_9ACTN|nr:hypothetical protein [Streptomyces lavenduligriseus]MCL3994130.1 hypothetical protein [Streptomyces lavenduligriseus]